MRQIWNIIKYLIVFSANLLMLFFLHGYFNLMILILMVVIPFVSLVVARYTLSVLSVSFDGAKESVPIQDAFLLKIVLNNPSFFPMLNVDISLHTSNEFLKLEGRQVLNVPAYARQKNDVRYPLSSEYLGLLTVEADELRVTDWMGFVTFKKQIHARKEIVLLPFSAIRVEPDMAALSNGMTELSESKKKGNDFSEVQDVREYQPGDKLQNIHWKLSAKKDVLMVKDRVSMASSQLLFLVELYQNEIMILSDILMAAYGVASYLLEQQLPFTLYWWSVRDHELKSLYIDTMQELNDWIELIYFENYYEEPDLGCIMLRQLLQEDTPFMAVGAAGTRDSDVLFQYHGDVEGYICD